MRASEGAGPSTHARSVKASAGARRRWAVVLACLVISLAVGLGAASDTALSRDPGQTGPREASYWTALDDGYVKCRLCPRECVVPPGERGHCGVRENRDGVYFTLTYGNPCALHVDPIEKKPFYHFLPATSAFSIATAGCNLDCRFCQNWQISQSRPEELRSYDLPPGKLVDAAVESGAPSIAYTYSEPTIFFEYMLECARIAHERGLRNVYHSNGFINEAPLRELCRYLDAANIDLKGMSEEYYRDMTGGSLAPVLRTLTILREEGVHVEITTLVVPGRNDDPETLRRECEWIRDNLGTDVPLHFSRFYPQHRLSDLPPTPIETLERARSTALDCGLLYVYIGNVPGHEASHTCCPACGERLIERVGYSVTFKAFEKGRCGACGEPIAGVFQAQEAVDTAPTVH